MKKGKKKFWDREVGLSTKPSEDLAKFVHWLEREHGHAYLNPLASVLDLGCGNGRNLAYLARDYRVRGIGYDSSKDAIAQATKLSAELPLAYQVRSIAESLPPKDNSQTIILDMMSSHFLNQAERKSLRAEIARVLKPGGWLFYKTFLRDEDEHAARLLREHPGTEPGTYIHPEIGAAEHVFTESEIAQDLAEHFAIHKINKSHRHHASAGGKRRSISVYAQKI